MCHATILCTAQHMALTIDEELSLHNRLLTELDEDVTVTHSRMKARQSLLDPVKAEKAGFCYLLMTGYLRPAISGL